MLRPTAILTVLLLCQIPALAAQGADEVDIRSAVIHLYETLNSHDADSFVQYMLPDGYTEFSAGGGPLSTLSEQYIRNALASDLEIDLQVENLGVRQFGDAAFVTGYRVGSITSPGEVPRPQRLCLSMMWVRVHGEWKLAHVHLSPSNE